MARGRRCGVVYIDALKFLGTRAGDALVVGDYRFEKRVLLPRDRPSVSRLRGFAKDVVN